MNNYYFLNIKACSFLFHLAANVLDMPIAHTHKNTTLRLVPCDGTADAFLSLAAFKPTEGGENRRRRGLELFELYKSCTFIDLTFSNCIILIN